MIKIVAFVGSPRKNGNVDTIIQKILDGATSNNAIIKKFHLNDMNIK